MATVVVKGKGGDSIILKDDSNHGDSGNFASIFRSPPGLPGSGFQTERS